MVFFKRNIILFATFGIAILYVITPANANIKLCLAELIEDNFNINEDTGISNAVYASLHRNAFRTPYGKAYSGCLLGGRIDLGPNLFCLWINENHSDIQLWNDLNASIPANRAELQHICMFQLENDGFNITPVNNDDANIRILNENMTRALQHEDVFRTPNSKAYRNSFWIGVNMIPNQFCLWLSGDVEYYNYQWKHLREQIAYDICFHYVEGDGFDVQTINWIDNRNLVLSNVINNNRVRSLYGLKLLPYFQLENEYLGSYMNVNRFCRYYGLNYREI